MKSVKFAALSAAVAALAAAPASFGVTLRFNGLSNSSPGNTDTGEMQLTVDAFDSSDDLRNGFFNTVDFMFRNDGPVAASISAIYFQGGGVLYQSGMIVDQSEGVNFASPASPSALPGGDDADFSSDFSFGEFINGRNAAGVDPGEFITIRFGLMGDLNFSDFLEALLAGEVRIGLLVRGFGDQGEETFLNDPTPVSTIPLPSAAMLGLCGMAGLAYRRRRLTD